MHSSKRIRDDARAGGYPEPVWEVNGFTTAVFRPNPDVRAAVEAHALGVGRPEGSPPLMYPSCTPHVLKALASAGEPLSRATLQQAAGLRDRLHFIREHLRPMLAAGLLELTLPDRLRSTKQRYRLTEAGRALLARLQSTE